MSTNTTNAAGTKICRRRKPLGAAGNAWRNRRSPVWRLASYFDPYQIRTQIMVWRPKEQDSVGFSFRWRPTNTDLLCRRGCVTSFDQSSEQLNKDAQVAQREGLAIECIQGDMADLSVFDDASFDIIFHPVSNIFAADIRPVWQHCARILRPGGRLLSGFMNPDFYLFDHWAIEDGGPLEVRFKLPYADLTHVDPATLEARMAEGEALEFSHSLDEQIGGQLAAGLVVAGLRRPLE